jgi:hypothetical protein
MDFFIKETNVRAGNRGGKNLFNWDDVRLMPNRERQSYLGSTQALGLMDRGGKWYRRDWWTHYDNKVNVYGHKDRLNNRLTLLEEQKEIRKQEKEKLNEFIYGKKKKNAINTNMNDIESVKDSLYKTEINTTLSIPTKTEVTEIRRPGLGMNNEIIPEKENGRESYAKKSANDDNKKRHSNHHHHHHHHHKSRSKNINRSRNRSRSRSRSRKRSKNKSKDRNRIKSKLEIIHKNYREDMK